MEYSNYDCMKHRSSNAVLDIVIPVYQEESHIVNSISVIKDILDSAKVIHKFILVDDGSKDNTWLQLKLLANTNRDVTSIRLSRNFGKEAAICAGIEYSEGDMLVVMDSDLQHPPSLIPEMVRIWREEDYDVIEGVKKTRGKENRLYRFCAKLFYKFIYQTSTIDLRNASDFKLLDKKVVLAWKSMEERTTFFRGMSAWVGYTRKQILFDVQDRVDGNTKWSIMRLIKLAVNATTSYTTIPLQFISIFGVILLGISIILGIQTLVMKLIGNASDGFTTVIILILLIGSCIMISLGIIGIYLAKIYHEVKGRPRYLVSGCIREGEEIC